MRVKEFNLIHSVSILASAECVWRHITEVDISAFRHPAYLSLLGIPKPLRSKITHAGVGGERLAYFDNGKHFTQEITLWKPCEEYSFTFRADPGFRVGYVLDLSQGPFRIASGTYTIAQRDQEVGLQLTSRYELHGVSGLCLSLPVWLIMRVFQRNLLQGIKANAEQENAKRNRDD